MPEIRAVHDGERAFDSPIMSSAPRVCRKCGAEVFADAPEGLCTACLFETGLSLLANDGQPISEGGTASPKTIHAFGERVPRQKTESIPQNPFANFGDYELLEVIGRGGQGVVYRARQKSLNRTVALKVIGLGHWATDGHLKRFRREAEAAASLDHFGIVPIYEVGERDGSCYFSMKLIEGGQLDEVSKREAMPIRRAVELIAKVARTVHYAHEHSILHRDIKPGNILLDQKGEPHLTDFGLARLVETESTVTRTLEVLGTPSYMAPEQAVGNNSAVGTTSDVYGLGAVLYQLLTGHPPFAGGTTYETIKLLLDTEPRSPRLWNSSIDRDLSTICLKCLEKEPKRRYSLALALAEDLEHWLKHEPILARRTGIVDRSKKWVQRNPTSALLAASLIALAAAAGWIIWKSELVRKPLTTGIAVLPFENLGEEKEHAFFADGVQDDILTKLAKIADLKVISRSSVMQYRGKQDVRQIGNALGVSHVLEGTVRRAGGKLHVNAQLVDARTNENIWAEEYDRDLGDMFGIPSEIAQKVAQQLHTKISASEKLAIESKPTADVTAFDLYTRGKNILLDGHNQTKAEYLEAIDLLNQAVARDPSFFDAYCQLAYAHDWVYFHGGYGLDHTPARLALAEAAIQEAARLNPDAGETHLARAQNLYWGYLDYNGALAELETARQTLPNDFRVPRLMGRIQRRQERWEESTRNLERSAELNPRDIETRMAIANNYTFLRRYADLKSALASTLAVFPNDLDWAYWPAYVEFQAKADTRPLHQMIDSIRATNPTPTPDIAEWWLACALAERDSTAAKKASDAHGENPIDLGSEFFLSRSLVEGLIARMTKDEAKVQSAFVAARAEQQKVVQAQPSDGQELGLLGLIDAYLGRKEEALREGRRALELFPMEKDPLEGVRNKVNLAMIAAWVGDNNLAFEQLESIIRRPSALSYGGLKLFPWWDPLRGDPRFEKILEEAKQPVALK
jgi:TolB-like protein/predicted Ser/Thr protein kinase/Flp pilus assembly protein TadD